MFVYLIFICVFFINKYSYTGNVIQVSSIDNKGYFVNNRHGNRIKLGVSDRICTIRSKGEQLINIIKNDPEKMENPSFKRLVKRWKHIRIEELNSVHSDIFAYNVNKGEIISLCIVKQGKFNELNELMFVFLHELAHSMTIEVGHPKEFWENFKKLLIICINNDLYTYRNYNTVSAAFCKNEITHTPLLL